MTSEEKIQYPYLPEGREIHYVSADHPWMRAAREVADSHSACSFWPTGAVVVKDGKIIGRGANSGNCFRPICPRVAEHCKTGEGYHLCRDLCEQDGHSEITATDDAMKNTADASGADLYLYGHWWCCKPCWDRMIACGIRNIYLLENAHHVFTRENRMKLLEENQRRLERGENIYPKDVRWTLD